MTQVAQRVSDPQAAVENWAAGWSSHDVNLLLSLFTEDCLYEDVTLGVVNRGKDELKAFAEGFFAFSPDLRLQVTRSGASAGFAACEWRF